MMLSAHPNYWFLKLVGESFPATSCLNVYWFALNPDYLGVALLLGFTLLWTTQSNCQFFWVWRQSSGIWLCYESTVSLFMLTRQRTEALKVAATSNWKSSTIHHIQVCYYSGTLVDLGKTRVTEAFESLQDFWFLLWTMQTFPSKIPRCYLLLMESFSVAFISYCSMKASLSIST